MGLSDSDRYLTSILSNNTTTIQADFKSQHEVKIKKRYLPRPNYTHPPFKVSGEYKGMSHKMARMRAAFVFFNNQNPTIPTSNDNNDNNNEATINIDHNNRSIVLPKTCFNGDSAKQSSLFFLRSLVTMINILNFKKKIKQAAIRIVGIVKHFACIARRN